MFSIGGVGCDGRPKYGPQAGQRGVDFVLSYWGKEEIAGKSLILKGCGYSLRRNLINEMDH
jgi:hypothetical protein